MRIAEQIIPGRDSVMFFLMNFMNYECLKFRTPNVEFICNLYKWIAIRKDFKHNSKPLAERSFNFGFAYHNFLRIDFCLKTHKLQTIFFCENKFLKINFIEINVFRNFNFE